MCIRPRENHLAHFTPTRAERQFHHHAVTLSVRVLDDDVKIAILLDSHEFDPAGNCIPNILRRHATGTVTDLTAWSLPRGYLRGRDWFDVDLVRGRFCQIRFRGPSGNAVISFARTWRSKDDGRLRLSRGRAYIKN